MNYQVEPAFWQYIIGGVAALGIVYLLYQILPVILMFTMTYYMLQAIGDVLRGIES